MAPQKSTSRTVYWFCTLVVLIVFVSSYAFMDLATEHLHMYVKVKHEQFNNKPLPLDLTCVPTGQILTVGDDDGHRDMSTSNGSGNTEVDFELSSLTEDEFDEKLINGERLSPTADSANDAEENGKVSLLDMKNVLDDSSKDLQSTDQNTSYRHDRYDPQAYIDLYKNISEGSMKIADSPPVIFVMAEWRFGSSVFGELFNQNSDLFFLFEPLWTTNLLRKMKGIALDTPESQRMSRNILRKFTKCQFDADFVRILETWNGKTQNKAICKASPKCKLISPNWMNSVCRKYKGRIAAKLIRANLELLKPLVVDDKINLKIIHLVRDPRGSAFSRINYRLRLSGSVTPAMRAQFPKVGRLKPLKLFSVTPETSQTVRGMCKWIRENIIVSPDLLPDWLQGRYYLVRYEDFADTPLKVARELYRFAGIPFHKEVQDWVIQNTHVPVSNKEVFSTHKNSHVAATHWMKDLTKMEISQVEGECMDVLKLMGYEPYSQLIQQEKLR